MDTSHQRDCVPKSHLYLLPNLLMSTVFVTEIMKFKSMLHGLIKRVQKSF